MKKTLLFYSLILCVLSGSTAFSQNLKTDIQSSLYNGKLLTDMIDTSTRMGKNMLSLYNKFGQIGFSGYLQPQFQYAESKGSPNIFQGGDWGANSDNRFRLRRGRLRTDFAHYTEDGKPSVYFLFQFDGTERGVNIRDFWGRYYENKWELFHFSAGMMARPFGHEVLLSSIFREAPERGRMSQTIMNTERDLGFMISLNPRKATSKMRWFAIDLGVYNGQGLTGPMEYDSHKDIVFRISSRRQTLIKSMGAKISGGLSGYFGGITNQNARLYTMQQQDGIWRMQSDSLASNIGRNGSRRYFGADVQLVIPNRNGQTEFRAEYIRGLQTASLTNSTTPGTYPVDGAGAALPLATRPFDGAYVYFLQHLGSWQHQVVLKFDWYDPNTRVSGKQISKEKGLSPADIRYNTIGGGYLYYINAYLKLVFWYEHPINEKTALTGYDKDLKDGIFTCRAQFSF
ncbi:porin [Taibaiella koreensis]|uniref:porin n=1 Tax=Taibaiella koreensis TaxID=1268548 RepID=UPI001F09B8C0|nr:porin [Taibaiella koreensis]